MGIILVPIFFLVTAALQLHVVSKVAKAEDRSFWHYVEVWYEPAAAKQYTSLTLMAVKRVDSAFFGLLIAGLFGAINIATFLQRQRLGGALRRLETPGALDGPRSDA
jgi:hypothetical protein